MPEESKEKKNRQKEIRFSLNDEEFKRLKDIAKKEGLKPNSYSKRACFRMMNERDY